MKTYRTLKEINNDLKVYNLERQIALERLKTVKYEIKSSLQPLNWVRYVSKVISKYGLMLFVKKILK
ncbi:hypothetical protein LV716_02505 [Flagellimonas sp. HMM57]|uniref:hypothetical protein n=1 Tax=unclassified Flagellimonas TaxID=2644544 RepID=UPI0013D0F329|nr:MULTISPECIES: hypothetical protein [unclassified Flagellimonas]UII76677.1 hypothetical protein LV716_02505 [Flagellimonas sp. HMM57]